MSSSVAHQRNDRRTAGVNPRDTHRRRAADGAASRPLPRPPPVACLPWMCRPGGANGVFVMCWDGVDRPGCRNHRASGERRAATPPPQRAGRGSSTEAAIRARSTRGSAPPRRSCRPSAAGSTRRAERPDRSGRRCRQRLGRDRHEPRPVASPSLRDLAATRLRQMPARVSEESCWLVTSAIRSGGS